MVQMSEVWLEWDIFITNGLCCFVFVPTWTSERSYHEPIFEILSPVQAHIQQIFAEIKEKTNHMHAKCGKKAAEPWETVVFVSTNVFRKHKYKLA